MEGGLEETTGIYQLGSVESKVDSATDPKASSTSGRHETQIY